ncbi:pyroglutamyl-peptidase 1 isoform X4 [Eulemur rufifrons]|uniref:pyroglutamyl-peptidase 1 isoform X4 n=1 Tax=Eulemur rufifrons TaxID=859984 RepID=UPI003744695D
MEQPRKAVVVTELFASAGDIFTISILQKGKPRSLHGGHLVWFGPFGEHTVNASWIAVQELEKLGLGDSVDLHVYEIPVEYKTVQRLIPALWEKHSPQGRVAQPRPWADSRAPWGQGRKPAGNPPGPVFLKGEVLVPVGTPLASHPSLPFQCSPGLAGGICLSRKPILQRGSRGRVRPDQSICKWASSSAASM